MPRKGNTMARFAAAPHALRPEKQAEILRYLRSGMPGREAARRAGVASSTVIPCARNNGLTDYVRGRPGAPKGSRKPKPAIWTATDGTPNYRAMASNLRWGGEGFR